MPRLIALGVVAGVCAAVGLAGTAAAAMKEGPIAGETPGWYVSLGDDDDDGEGEGEGEGGGEGADGAAPGDVVRPPPPEGTRPVPASDPPATVPAPTAPAPTGPAPPASAPAPATSAPPVATVRNPPIADAQLVRPHIVTPALGRSVATLRPTLRWTHAVRGVRLYNVQVFNRGRKVVSIFATERSYRLPPGRLAYARRYVWRVWPYMASDGYTARPLAVSWFSTPPRPRADR